MHILSKIMLLVLGAVLVLSALIALPLYQLAAARARTAGTYCTRQGARLHGGLALWSPDDGETWYWPEGE